MLKISSKALYFLIKDANFNTYYNALLITWNFIIFLYPPNYKMLYDSEVINQGKYFFKTIKKWDVTEQWLTLWTAASSTL